jgi:hypothetical protein
MFFILCSIWSVRLIVLVDSEMNIADYNIGLSSKAVNFKHSRRTNRLTPEEEQRFLREQCAIQDRRRRDWAKRRRAAQQRRGTNRHRPARDREALSRLRSAVSSTDHDHADAAAIIQKFADCVARKSPCRLWICSRCSSERSHEQVERLVGNLADHDHSALAAFTVILGAIGLNGSASAEAAAAEARRQIERLRQHAKRSGIDLGYWGQVELKIVRTSELDETDHIAATLADINPTSLDFPAVLVPHVHGIVRTGGTIHEARQFFQAVFPASRQVVVKNLHDDQTTANAVSTWASYSTKAKVKTKAERTA